MDIFEDINLLESTDNVMEYAEAMSNYGSSIVIIATFIVVFLFVVTFLLVGAIKSSKDTRKQNELLVKTIQEQNNKFMDNCMTQAKEHVVHVEPELVNTYISVNLSLKSICKSILGKFSADRVAVYVFHNGNVSAHGLPFFKVSCIGEWIKIPNLSRGRAHSDLPLYTISDIVEKLYNEGKVQILENDFDENQKFINVMGTGKTKSIFIYQIVDSNDNLAGFTLLEYYKDFDNELIELNTSMLENNKIIANIITDSNIQDELKQQ